MSFSDAIGHIDQIVQWEQQLSSPAALDPSASPGGSAATTSTGPAAPAGGAFADALAQAQSQGGAGALSQIGTQAGAAAGGSLGTAGSAGTSSLLSGGDSQLLSALSSQAGTGTSSSAMLSALESALPAGAAGAGATDPRIQAMIQKADSLVGKPYVWGGGHGGWGPQAGYDCSGFVSAVLHAGGYLSTPEDTTTMPSGSGIESGPGQHVTIYDRNAPGTQGHVIIEIDGQFYESGGEQGSWGGGGGVAKISTPSASYLATFNQVLHPAGL